VNVTNVYEEERPPKTLEGTQACLDECRNIFAPGNDLDPAIFGTLGDCELFCTEPEDPSVAGTICANVYAFSPTEQMISCCSCPVSPNALRSFSIQNDVLSNTFTVSKPTSVVIKLLASLPQGGCNASSPKVVSLARGMAAWGTTLHAQPSGSYGVTETKFVGSGLSTSELSRLTTLCGFIQNTGSGFGLCTSCNSSGLGGR
jgi:hypothetical protein